MKSIIARGMCIAALALASGMASAQDSANRVGVNTDWNVYEEKDFSECWAVSVPKETVNTKNGRPAAVTRGEILLYVSYWPKQDRAGEVSFTGGYTFAKGSTVKLTVGDSSFDLFTEGESAWSEGPDADAKIISAMKKGSKAVVVGNSSRGTRTEDTFSLFGFTASVEDAAKRCSG